MNERQLQKKLQTGWNTWDVRSVTTHVFLPDRFALRFAVMDAASRNYMAEFGWPEVERFGPHAVDGSYTCVDLVFGGHRLRIETAAEGREFAAVVTPVSQRPFHLQVEASMLWGGTGAVRAAGSAIEARIAGGAAHMVRASARHSPPPGDPSMAPHIAIPMSGPAAVCCNCSMSVEQAAAFIARKREAWHAGESLRADGPLGEALDALHATVAWNTFFDPTTSRVMTPVSRMWSRGTAGGYVLFEWDTFFLGLLASPWHKELAYANVLAMLGEIVPEGHVPNMATHALVSRDRSEPPVGAYCVLKLWREHGDRWFIAECFDRLERWNRFWFEKRDHNRTGLLEWGSDPYPIEPHMPGWLSKNVGERQGAMWESGLDNAPMWDDAVFNTKHHCLELKDIGLNALVALDCECLAILADALGKDAATRELRARGRKLAKRIETLWDARSRLYLGRHWNGKPSTRLSPCNFYPLTAGLPDAARAREMVERHLLNPKEFWGTWVIPSIARNDKAYKDQNYWRGRIWGPMNYIVYQGLRRYDALGGVASRFARKSVDLLLKEWREKGHVHENYNGTTGEGCDVKSSDPNYHWGALLARIGLEELIDVEPFDGGLCLGSTVRNAGSVDNVRVGGHRYGVSVTDGLKVTEDGEVLVECDRPVRIRRLRREGRWLVFDVQPGRAARLTVRGAAKAEASAGRLHTAAGRAVWFMPEGGGRLTAR